MTLDIPDPSVVVYPNVEFSLFLDPVSKIGVPIKKDKVALEMTWKMTVKIKVTVVCPLYSLQSLVILLLICIFDKLLDIFFSFTSINVKSPF